MTAATARLRRLTGRPHSWPRFDRHWQARLLTRLDAAPRRTGTWSAVAAATLAGLALGPVAAAIAACYTGMAVLAYARHRQEAAARRRRAAARDAIAALAADLRAGADITTALTEARVHLGRDGSGSPSSANAPTTGRRADQWTPASPPFAHSPTTGRRADPWTPAHPRPGTSADEHSRRERTPRPASATGEDPVCRRIHARLDAAIRIAETTGAPIAELLDRLAADLRAGARVEATLSTHTAGSHAGSRLLAALPIAGLGLGQALGTDPIATLLHTPVGAGCAMTALALQLAGLAWSRRILATATSGDPS